MEHHHGPAPRRRSIAGSDGLELAVWERGPADAPTVVLVHGYPDTHSVWDLVGERLVDDHHVVAYDVRGAGQSATPADTAGYHQAHLTADLLAVLDATSPGRPAHLVGHDWGSIQCWGALADPSVEARLVSYTSMSGPGLDHVDRWVRSHRSPGGGHWRAAANQAVRSWYIAAFQTPLAFVPWHLGIDRRLPKLLARREGARVDEHWPGPTLAADGRNGVHLYRANMGRGAERPTGTRTDLPVQLIVAARDPYVTPALLDGMEAIAPNLVRHEIDGMHWLPRSHPDVIADLVRAHVAATEAHEP
jgi:pimeloyl-ACP methyl ester carboxylesterase